MHNEKERPTEYFPDGTPIDDWFYDIGMPELEELGRPYVLTEYGIWDDGKVYTKEIQKVIDLAAEGRWCPGGAAGNLSDGSTLFQTGSESLCFRRCDVKGQR